MDDDSCVLKYIEIVPVDDYVTSDVESSPYRVKVCMHFILYLCTVSMSDCHFITGPPTCSVGGSIVLPVGVCHRLSLSVFCNTLQRRIVTHQGAARDGI